MQGGGAAAPLGATNCEQMLIDVAAAVKRRKTVKPFGGRATNYGDNRKRTGIGIRGDARALLKEFVHPIIPTTKLYIRLKSDIARRARD